MWRIAQTTLDFRRARNSSQSSRGQKGVSHGLHIHQAKSLELPDWRSNDSRFGLGLNNSASHRLENTFGKSSVTLEGRGADISYGTGSSRNSGDGERVRSAAGVTLNLIVKGVDVGIFRNMVHVKSLSILGLLSHNHDSKAFHHAHRHIRFSLPYILSPNTLAS